MVSDLMKIKDKYGERMMQLCRELFPTILEQEGKLFDLLSSNFVYSKDLYDDIVNNAMKDCFKDFIYGLLEPNDELVFVDKTPEELLNEVGYILYECKTEDDVQSFRKYYTSKEKLCTFRGGRLMRCHVFFAVKENALEMERENYLTPLRQDSYGTSVISIQFTRGKNNTLSIKNRYNHSVNNPDATYSNNLENIVPGLTRSFEREYGLNITQNGIEELGIPGYVRAKDGKYYKYNYEINNIYYCDNNIIIDNFEVIDKYKDKEKYLIIDYFIIDLINKKISLYDKTIEDSFLDNLNNIKKIEISKCRKSKNKILKIIFEDETDAVIEIDRCNRMISYSNKNIDKIGDNFLKNNKYLKKIDISNVQTIGDKCLYENTTLNEINIVKILKMGSDFLYSNRLLSTIELPKLIEVKDNLLYENKILNSINAPKLIKVGNNFLHDNEGVISICMPSLNMVGDNFFSENKNIIEIDCPSLVSVGNYFLQHNIGMEVVSLESLVNVGRNFICANKIIKYLYLPNLIRVGDSFLYCNRGLKQLVMESLEYVGDNFLCSNRLLELLSLPKVRYIGSKFLYQNISLLKLELYSLVSVGRYFLYNNNSLLELWASNLEVVGSYFLSQNNVLDFGDLFSLKEYGNYFLSCNISGKNKLLKIAN